MALNENDKKRIEEEKNTELDGNWLADIDFIRTYWQTTEERFYIPNYN